MGWFDWVEDIIPKGLSVDQEVQQTPVLPQQETLSPQAWLAQQNAQQAQRQVQEQEQQAGSQMSVDMSLPEVTTPQAAQEENRVLSPQEWLAQQPKAQETPFQLEDTTNLLYKGVKALAEPASSALEAISYLDKPRGAIAGGVVALQNDTPLLEGAKKGWEENTSWKETFNPEWVKENPKTAAVAGLAADIVADPLWVVTPAKIASGVKQVSKATGLTDNLINPTVNAAKGTEFGQKAIAFAEDATGLNRVADEGFDFNAGRATDQLNADDLVDSVKGLKKQYGEDANKLTDYIEASPKATDSLLTRPAEIAEVADMAKTGKLVKAIDEGVVSKNQAFNALRDAGEEIPDYLLQNNQRFSKSIGEAIPDTITRDSVLKAIPDDNLRKAIENIGEQFIAKNKANADRLRATGRLSDEAYISYLDGEHLRRSFKQYETPEQFLEALRKSGDNVEYSRVYQALARAKQGSQGYGANHKIDMKDFIQRQTLSEDTLKKLGLVKDPEYRIMDTLNRSSKTLREDEFLERVNTLWGKNGDDAAELSMKLPKRRQYVPIPESKSYGALAGKWVPKDIHDQVIKLTGTGASSSELVNAWQKGVSWFKVAKLANPASTMRNFYSGIPMANVFGKVPMQAMPKYMAKATQAIRGGNNNPLMREVKGTGILGNVWNKQDLKNIIGDNPTGIKKLADKGMNAFGKPDEFWRITTYAYHRDQGKSVREAAEIANKALFDYSNAPEWINTLSRTGAVPFAKFPYFATKETAKALWNKPAQVTKFTKAQNQVNNEDREKIMPDYMKARTLLPLGEGIRIVNGKPQKVQNNLDLSYILPFANDIKLGNPALDALIMSRIGKNGLGQEVIKKGMTPTEKAKVWGEWGYNTLGPSFPLPGNYAGEKLSNAFAGRVDAKGRQYDLVDAVAQTILGLKNAPVNSQEMFNQKVTALTNEQRNIKAIMNQIAKDQSLSKEQKAERIKEHQSQIKEIGKELKETAQAWQREKKRGSN